MFMLPTLIIVFYLKRMDEVFTYSISNILSISIADIRQCFIIEYSPNDTVIECKIAPYPHILTVANIEEPQVRENLKPEYPAVEVHRSCCGKGVVKLSGVIEICPDNFCLCLVYNSPVTIDNALDIRLLDDIFCNHTSLVFSEDRHRNKKGEGQLLRCLRLRKTGIIIILL